MATAERPWSASRVSMLAQQPGTHYHPTEKGMCLRVSPKGRAVFAFRLRDVFHKEVGGTLGPVSELSLEDAIRKFRAQQEFHRTKATPKGLTLDDAFKEWIVEHKKSNGDVLAPETIRYYTLGYKRYLKPKAGTWQLGKVQTHEWVALLKEVRERSPHQARGMLWLLHSIYERYVDLEIVERNPLAKRTVRLDFAGRDVRTPRTGHVKAIDLRRFMQNWKGLRNEHSKDAILLLLATGWRKSAVLRLKWGSLDLDHGTHTVPEKVPGWKGYVGVVPLNDYAVSILQQRANALRSKKQQWVFPARHGAIKERPYMADLRGSLAHCCEGLGYVVTAHDLRRTFATVAEMVLDGNLRHVGQLLTHRQKGTQGESDSTSGYVMRNVDAEREMSQRVAATLLEMGGLLPVSADTEALLLRNGISNPGHLQLKSLADDEDAADTAADADA